MNKGDRVMETKSDRPRSGLIEDVANLRIGERQVHRMVKVRWNDGSLTIHTLPDEKIKETT